MREEEREMFPLLADQGVGSIPWSPLAKGRLARPWGEQSSKRAQVDPLLDRFQEDDDRPIADVVEAIAAERGISMAQVALAWVMRNPVVCAPIVGASEASQLEAAVAATEVQLTDEEVYRLEAPYTMRAPTGY
jgi:aryl-alcohol dehydrogenase-like predicted oxidoreductase